jgi:hypothetical protein
MRRYTVISVPGREDDDQATWFVWDKETRNADRFASRQEALAACRERNRAADKSGK